MTLASETISLVSFSVDVDFVLAAGPFSAALGEVVMASFAAVLAERFLLFVVCGTFSLLVSWGGTSIAAFAERLVKWLVAFVSVAMAM